MRASPRADPYVRNYRIRLLPRVVAETGPSQPRARSRVNIASVRLCVRNAALVSVLPLADRLPSTTSAGAMGAPLFGGFSGTTRSSDFPGACMPDVRSWTFSGRPAVGPVGTRGISRFPCGESPRMHRVSDCAGSEDGLPRSPPSVLPSASLNRIGTPERLISQLDGWPACAPVNASPASLRPPTHDSGSG